MSIYTTQTDLVLNIETNIDLSQSTTVMKYKAPDGTEDELTCTVSGNVATFENYPENPFTQVGTYAVWLKISNPDGTVSIGEPSKITFKAEGT